MSRALAIVAALALTGAASAANGPLSLSADSDRVVLIAGDMTIRTNGPRFSLSGPYGNYSSDAANAANMTVANVDVQTNADSEKRVTLTTKPFALRDATYVFRLTLSAEMDRPGILIETALKNVGAYPAQARYFFKLVPIRFAYYQDAGGEWSAANGDIPLKDWLFLPTANIVGGYGVVFAESENLSLTTLYPRADWRAAGWYFAPKTDRGKPRYLKPGEENAVRFRIFPAKRAEDVAAVTPW